MMHPTKFVQRAFPSARQLAVLLLLGSLCCLTTLAAASTLTITTTSPLPNGTVDQFYSNAFAASGGTAPYTWTITNGSVPGLIFTSTGVLTGVPNAASAYTLTVQVRDSAATPATASAQFNITTAVSTNTNYYVSTSGSDSNNGSSGSPWKTIAYAISKVAGPGVTINVAAGTYYETADLGITTGGSASGGYFVLKSTTPQGAVIDGTNIPKPSSTPAGDYTYGVITIGNGTNTIGYVTVDGFQIQNFKTTNDSLVIGGISLQGAGSNIQLVNNYITAIQATGTSSKHNGSCQGSAPEGLALVVAGQNGTSPFTNISVIGNSLWNNITGCSETMTINGNVNGFIVANNLVHNNSNIGIAALGGEGVASGYTQYNNSPNDQARNGWVVGNTVYNIMSNGSQTTPPVPSGSNVYGSSCYCADGIYFDGSANNIAERNTVYATDLGIEVTGEGAGQNTTNNVVRDNLFFYNNVVGISIGGQGTPGGSSNTKVYNNTTWSNGVTSAPYIAMGEFATGTNLTGANYVENNIFYASTKTGTLVQAQTTSGVTFNHNLYYAPSGQNWCWGYNSRHGTCSTTYTTFSSYQSGSKQDANSQFADPLFVNIAVTPPTTLPNLNVNAGSPALGKGTIVSPASDLGPFDVTGVTPRILTSNNTVDVGAYEQ